MIFYLFRNLFFGLLAIALTSCSVNEHALITRDSSTSIDNCLVVIGIKWIDTYNDPGSEKLVEKSVTSNDLLENEDLIAGKEVSEGGSELYRALYYLSEFRFVFRDEQGEEHFFTRFGKDKNQYEHVAIYEFAPGNYTLTRVETIQHRVEENKRTIYIERWHRNQVDYEEVLGAWDFPKGKIVYLGDLTFYFSSTRFIYGLLTPDELVRKSDLERIEFQDRFEEMKNLLKAEKSWFPTDNMINLASENKWVYIQKERNMNREEKNMENEQPKKKNKNAFF